MSGPADATGGERGSFGAGRAVAYGAGNAGAGALFAFMNSAVPLYLAGYGFPNAWIGLFSQERPPTAGIGQVVIGALSDRTRSRLGRRRPYIVFGVPLAVLALLALIPHPPLALVVVLLLVLTMAFAAGYGPYLAMLPDLVPEDRRSRVGGVLNLANMLGQLVVLVVAMQLWSANEPLVFWLVAAALVIGFAVTVLFVPERPLAAAPPPVRIDLGAYVRGLFAHREVMKFLFATLFFWFGTAGVVPFITNFAMRELDATEAAAFQLFIVAVVGTALGTLPAGWLGDRVGKKPVMIGGLTVLGTAALVASQVRTVEAAMVAMAVIGLANAAVTTPLLPFLADLIPRERAGEFSGIGTGVWEFAQPFGAIAGGLVADATGSLRWTLVAAGALVLVAAALLTRVRAPRIASRPPAGT
ncbi:MAG TPA: MFS transporter [Candidatus Limnocylindria bacterium]|nr:MFS transporter [Candidatus Limnocylindria bacterium]